MSTGGEYVTMALSKNDYKVLYQFYQFDCTNAMKSLTIERMSELTELSVSKIRKTVIEFKKLLYISEGVPQRCAKTYYITKKGINKVQKLMEVS